MKFNRILLVDDDDDDQLIFEDALHDIDDTIHFDKAKNAEEALLRLKNGQNLPDIIFIDLNMPKMNGHELLAEIEKDPGLKNIPVVIYTTSKSSGLYGEPSIIARYFFRKQSDFLVLKKELNKLSISIEDL